MRVFLSWSGATSQQIASELHGWLPIVLQNAEPYMTPADIEKGARWQAEIADRLSDCNFGVLCLTQDNLTAPWILFEAGALSKVPNARVATVLFGVAPGDLPAPLGQFQATRFVKEEVLQLMQTMNGALPEGERRRDDVLLRAFNMAWPELDTKIGLVLKSAAAAPTPPRPPAEERIDAALDMLQELLAMSRQNASVLASPERLAEQLADHLAPIFTALMAEAIKLAQVGTGSTATAAELQGLITRKSTFEWPALRARPKEFATLTALARELAEEIRRTPSHSAETKSVAPPTAAGTSASAEAKDMDEPKDK